MNDEFMAYGEGGQISAITLAMMEELGHYKAEYSNAQCMLWGRNQGCAFVESRCGARTDDLGVVITGSQTCARPYLLQGMHLSSNPSICPCFGSIYDIYSSE